MNIEQKWVPSKTPRFPRWPVALKVREGTLIARRWEHSTRHCGRWGKIPIVTSKVIRSWRRKIYLKEIFEKDCRLFRSGKRIRY
ncbi:hypothetical protein AKJ64_03075 [candidate division MSBL1 archaeon SCGC-AAA259E17]|uniref:Uncharacterized protein n=1 Tax=candidate division MSBL1 archaeon SCGC-AAA259E17 TaxID=1698263 RepID=A0A133UE76_9EURY|nr:hypothetical protein AKJ64_03075 [candidate division MSBL1 archaeon SCGC-AAA259E17]